MVRRNTALTLAAMVLVLVSQIAVAVELTANGKRITGPDNDFRNSAAPELYADVMLGSLTAQRAFRATLPSIHTYSQTAHMTAFGNDVESDSALASSDFGRKNWVMWDTPWLTHETRKADDGYLGYKNTSSGFATGISRLIGDSSAIGIAIGYDARKLTNRDGYHWRAKTDALHTAIYGGTALGCFFFDAYAGWSKSWHRSERGITSDTLADSPLIKGNYADMTVSGGAKLSYVWILPNEFRITPAVGVDYTYMRFESFNEFRQGVGDGFRVGKSTHHFVQTPITVSANKTFSANFLKFKGFCSMWTPEVKAGWVPQFGSKHTSIKYQGARFESTDLGKSYGFVGAGMKIKLADRFIFAVDYNYSFRDKYNNHTVTGTYGVSF